MRYSTIVTLLLIGSVSFNIYYWTGEREDAPDPECHITGPFADPKSISDDEAARFSEEYMGSLGTDEKTIGGIISRAAFDAMLCTEECNAVGYMLSRDKEGSTGPSDNGVFVVFRGLNVKYDPETKEITEVRKLHTPNFIGGYWCPPSCTP